MTWSSLLMMSRRVKLSSFTESMCLRSNVKFSDVMRDFRRNGVDLPRTSRQQAAAGRALAARVDSLKPGDLMLFSSKGVRIDHVAIYVGNNRMLHSSAGAGKVVYDDLTTLRGKWYLARHVASRRVL